MDYNNSEIGEEEIVEETIEIIKKKEPKIKKATSKKLTLEKIKEDENIKKIITYKKELSDKQKQHLEKLHTGNNAKRNNTKSKMTELEILQRENELLKREIELQNSKKKTEKPLKKEIELQNSKKPEKTVKKTASQLGWHIM